ncbi:transposable element Tcb2 transposase [Trichonephila clavipes]|nr:transposable element Tcb2 transposase [Trichonephila clavipes]
MSTHRCLRLEWCHVRGNWTSAKWHQVVFSGKSRFNLNSDYNRFRVWRPRGERLNPVFDLRLHTAPTAARVFQDCLHPVTAIPWPARSLELWSPIDHIRDHLGWRAGHPMSLNELEARLQQIWKEMSQGIMQNLNALMPDRITSCIRARGDQQDIKLSVLLHFFSEINDHFSLIF